MHRLLVAVAHFDHERGSVPSLALLDVLGEIAAEPLDVGRVLVQGFEQFENFGQLLRIEFFPVGEVLQLRTSSTPFCMRMRLSCTSSST
jgi:hypothetical protein